MGDSADSDDQAKCMGITANVCDAKSMLHMHETVAVLEPGGLLCKSLQSSSSGLPDVTSLYRKKLAGRQIRGHFLQNPPNADDVCR